jgi:predicted house-cleaning noncanonical NTP pyrophosphatase (MazG superfamily)
VKLIRDRVPEIMAAGGQRCAHRTATPAEYRAWLNAKLIEEAAEVIGATVPGPTATTDALAAELADVLEVVYAIGATNGLSPTMLERERHRKRATRGGLTRGVIWHGPDGAP